MRSTVEGGPEPYVTIGTQKWQRRNLDVTTYRNGDVIPYVADQTAWSSLTTGAWCWYNNDPELGKIYGKLYNGFAVRDSRGLAPEGWSMPTESDWATLISFVNSNSNNIKQTGTTLWASDSGATNSTKLTILPNGQRDASFSTLTTIARIWTSTYNNSNNTMQSVLIYGFNTLIPRSNTTILTGASVRCIKD